MSEVMDLRAFYRGRHRSGDGPPHEEPRLQFTVCTQSDSSSDVSASAAPGEMAAFFTAMSTRPKARSACAIM